jgi:hypothetical protein
VLPFFAAGLGCRCSWRHLVLKKTRQREPAGFDLSASGELIAEPFARQWCDQIPTPTENQLYPYSEHTRAYRRSHGSGKLFGD